MRLHDVISVAAFPAVVSGADITFLRQNPNSSKTADFLSGYLASDARSYEALRTSLSSLTNTENGGAFWLNGVFGSGKSHLLGVLTLLSEGVGHEVFVEAHPQFASNFAQWVPRLAVAISLDEFDATRWGLEDIFWRETEREWTRRELGSFEFDRSGSRVEAFAALDAALKERGLTGLVVCFDELSLFLGGRAHGELQGDASFLQFLGQHSRRAPLWVFAALQKTIDDISGLERYSLSQIRDRFTTLPLSLAHVPALIERRLVRVQNAAAVDELCSRSFGVLAVRLPRLDFGPQEWRALFPFHPATVTLLEAVTSRFFSRTRSAALFCARSIDLEREASWRVPPDAIWDYFEPELDAHPDLRPLGNIWRAWEESMPPASSEEERQNLRRVLKFLLLCKIAGQSPSPIIVANALNFELELGGDGAYEYARFLLEKLRTCGAFVAVERGEGPLFDRYTVDLGRRVGEMARRQVAATLESLPVGDARIAAHVLSVCRGEPLPLAELSAPHSISLFWQSTPRRLSVEVWDGTSPASLVNRVLSTREDGAPDDATLAIWPPFSHERTDWPTLFASVEESARAALWVWKPRSPARDEWDLAREVTAAHLATLDPGLGDNRRGRALLEHLQKEAPAQAVRLSRIALRLLVEGEVLLGNGAVLEASELARGESFAALLEAVGDFGWPHLFPKFSGVAPRARLLTPSNADSLCLEILRRPGDEPFFAPSLERLARHVGEPLGVAKASAGRWKIAGGAPELVAEMRRFLGDGAAFSGIEAHFAKSEWGLKAEQTAIVVCALLRGGEIAAFDGRGAELPPTQIGLPLRRAVHFLRPGQLPDSSQWTRLAVLAQQLTGTSFGALSFAEAQKVRDALLIWRETAQQNAELTRARAAQLRRQLGHPAESWPAFETAQSALSRLFETLPENGAAFDVLSRAATLDFETLREPLAASRRFEAALETRLAPLLSIHALLTHPELVAPGELAASRTALLERFAGGEGILFDEELLESGRLWLETYAAQYAAWHATQNDPARWNAWRRLSQSEELRAVERLGTLQNRVLTGEAVRPQIEAELAKRCPRDGALAPGEAVCSSCGLHPGQRLTLRDPREIEATLARELETLQRILSESGPRDFLTRQQSPLVEWDGESEALLPLLSSANLVVLDEALAPRRKVSRSSAALLQALQACRTRGEHEAAFGRWLDGGEGVGGEDEVELGA